MRPGFETSRVMSERVGHVAPISTPGLIQVGSGVLKTFLGLLGTGGKQGFSDSTNKFHVFLTLHEGGFQFLFTLLFRS